MAMQFGDNTVAQGSFTSDGNAKTITCGFKPRYVKFVTLDTSAFTGEFYNDMTAAHFIKVISHDTAQVAEISSNGVTLAADGFVLGTACVVNTKVTHWVAVR